MIYPKKKSDKAKGAKGTIGKSDDSELLALNKLLKDLDDEIDKRTMDSRTKKKKKVSKKKKGKKTRSKTPSMPKKVFGRDRKLRDHTKLKIFSEIEKKLFDTRIDNVKLGQFLKVKQKEKKNFIKYEWARDTNVMNLRFFSYLLMEEVETIIDNMDETRGMNYLNSVDAKLQKRNNIINHLLREKAVTAKLMTKILAIMENTAMDSSDLVNMLAHIDVKDKTRVLGKLKNIIEDMKAVEQIKKFSKGYFSEVDFQNLIAAQKGLKDPLREEHFDQLREIRTTFERVNRHSQISEEYQKIQDEMAVREKNYNDLVAKYEQLIGDFLNFIGTNNFEATGFTPEELKSIKDRYENMKKNEDSRFYGGKIEDKKNLDGEKNAYLKIEGEDDIMMSPRGDIETVKKIRRKKKKRSKSPSKRSRSVRKRGGGRRTKKKRKKSRKRGRTYTNSHKKRMDFEFTDSQEEDNYRDESPELDIELSRISKHKREMRKMNLPPPEFAYNRGVNQNGQMEYSNQAHYNNNNQNRLFNLQKGVNHQRSEPRLNNGNPNFGMPPVMSDHQGTNYQQPIANMHNMPPSPQLGNPTPPNLMVNNPHVNPPLISSKNSRVPMSDEVSAIVRKQDANRMGNNPEKPTTMPNPPPNLPAPPQPTGNNQHFKQPTPPPPGPPQPPKAENSSPPPPPPVQNNNTPPPPKKSPANHISEPPKPPAQPSPELSMHSSSKRGPKESHKDMSQSVKDNKSPSLSRKAPSSQLEISQKPITGESSYDLSGTNLVGTKGGKSSFNLSGTQGGNTSKPVEDSYMNMGGTNDDLSFQNSKSKGKTDTLGYLGANSKGSSLGLNNSKPSEPSFYNNSGAGGGSYNLSSAVGSNKNQDSLFDKSGQKSSIKNSYDAYTNKSDDDSDDMLMGGG